MKHAAGEFAGGRRAARHACVALLAGVLALGCAGGVGDEELRLPPIAILYWTHEDARQRLELARGEPSGPTRAGVARAGDIGRLFGLGDGADPGAANALYPGSLKLVDPGTGALQDVDAAPPGAVPMAWSPDRRRLMYVSNRGGAGWQLYAWDRETGDVRALTHGPAHHPRGDFGPDGRLVFTRYDEAGEHSVWVQEPGEAPRRLLTGAYAEMVRWQPGGDMLLLAVTEPTRRRRGGQPDRTLITVPFDAPEQSWPPEPGGGGALRSLGRGRDPAFGPGSSGPGAWIVYSAPIGDGWRLRRMRTEGGGRLAVGRGRRDELEPALSPDGALVAFVMEEAGYHRLFVRRVDGSGDRLLLTDGVAARPVW